MLQMCVSDRVIKSVIKQFLWLEKFRCGAGRLPRLKAKVEVTLEQATKAKKGSRVIAILFL